MVENNKNNHEKLVKIAGTAVGVGIALVALALLIKSISPPPPEEEKKEAVIQEVRVEKG